MQEEINQKTVALSVKAVKLTATVLKDAIKKFLEQQKEKSGELKHGKQSIKSLSKHNAGLSTIEINDSNIKAFEQTAKKYGLDFALKKDATETPPKYIVFFKGRDADTITQSFYVVTDPKGTVLVECGKLLQHNHYRIKVLNTINFSKSMHYNPFTYIRSEKDILKLVNTIIANTKGEGEKSSEDFWVKAERLYYTALIGYIWYEAPEDEKNFLTLLELINASEAREDDESFKNPVDMLFERLEEKDPEHFALKQYKKYKLAAGAVS